MILTECPVCHKKPAYAGNTPYCPSCGWNRASAISSLQMSLNSLPLAVLGFGGMAAFVWWGMKFKNAPQLMIFFVIPVLGVPLNFFFARRKLAKLRVMSGAPPSAAIPPIPSNFGPAVLAAASANPSFPLNPQDEALLHAPAPRQLRISKGGRISLWVTAFVLSAFTVPMAIGLYRQLSLTGSLSTVRGLGWAIALEAIVALAAFGAWRGQKRECDLLEHGEVVMGRVTRQWLDDKRNSWIDYEFTDFLGTSHRGGATDRTSKLFAGMPLIVFYDRDNPKRQIAYCSTLHEVILPFAPVAAPAPDELLAKR
jgi:hypothetical protein